MRNSTGSSSCDSGGSRDGTTFPNKATKSRYLGSGQYGSSEEQPHTSSPSSESNSCQGHAEKLEPDAKSAFFSETIMFALRV